MLVNFYCTTCHHIFVVTALRSLKVTISMSCNVWMHFLAGGGQTRRVFEALRYSFDWWPNHGCCQRDTWLGSVNIASTLYASITDISEVCHSQLPDFCVEALQDSSHRSSWGTYMLTDRRMDTCHNNSFLLQYRIYQSLCELLTLDVNTSTYMPYSLTQFTLLHVSCALFF
jgi:hypothetical protein